ncbi:MAG: SDR family NAD(P)-dependent oxidoreductase [Acidimicrobiales bacterium]|nr:SDR family NAD(P)-dependent oxidoreductase [Acidimicrobiales bacterium]
MFNLTGRTALVTGAGQNIGAGIARALGAMGANVLVNDLRTDRADEIVEELRSNGVTALSTVFDVTDRLAIDRAVAAHGPIDVLVNNAGNGGAETMLPKRFVDTNPADWRGPMQVNTDGVLHCCHAVLPTMVERGHGRIITISSAAGTHGVGLGFVPYSVGKGGSLSLMRSLALEHGRDGITANSVALGIMDSVRIETARALTQTVPAGRLGSPDDVGSLCAYLASDEAAWITGQTIGLNGGSFTS